MMLIVTNDTVRNPKILGVRQLPRKFFGRVTVWPAGRIRFPLAVRIIAEFQWVRYSLTLLPLIIIALIWNGAALPLSQAPILMLVIIWWVEMRLLRVPPSKRATLIDPIQSDRTLDLMRVRSKGILKKVAAGRGLNAGQLHLVIEQSELWLLSPLTYVSVQSEDGPEVLSLSAKERAIIEDQLFDESLSEATLSRINQSQNTFLRDFEFDARGVTAHARLAALLA